MTPFDTLDPRSAHAVQDDGHKIQGPDDEGTPVEFLAPRRIFDKQFDGLVTV